jgi:hypothetical protein
VPDGVFTRGADGGVVFQRLYPHRADLEALVQRIAARSEAWLEAQGGDDEPDPEDAQPALIAAAVEGRAAAGPSAGGSARRTRDVSLARSEGLGRGVSCDGYGLHAGTAVPAADRVGLERPALLALAFEAPRERGL